MPVHEQRIRKRDRNGIERAADARDEAGKNERDEDEAIAVDAEVAHPRFVLCDPLQGEPEGRAHDAKEDEEQCGEDR